MGNGHTKKVNEYVQYGKILSDIGIWIELRKNPHIISIQILRISELQMEII